MTDVNEQNFSPPFFPSLNFLLDVKSFPPLENVHTKAFLALIILTVLWLLPILQCLSALLNTFYV
jgi:hypothetical protein